MREPSTIRVALLPILDTLPLHVAQESGFFEEQGVKVEFVPVSSAPERDQLMQSGQIDAMVNELVSVLFYNEMETQVVVVRFARTATEEYPVFRILASADSDIQTPLDLRGIPIGISEGTVIEYTTDRLLERAGLASEEIEKIAVPRIPDRYALLESGELDAANLPDPLASLAIQGGARLILDDTSYPEISHSVISFSAEYLTSEPEAVRSFLKAIEQAIESINQDKQRWGDLLSEKGLVPPPLLGTYQVPDYPSASIPSEAQFTDALEWALEEGLIQSRPDYAESVKDEYLP
jgi:NitT/TauT family transport system substrate-binding protein